MPEDSDWSLIPHPGSGLARNEPAGRRIISEMVSCALTLAQQAAALVPRFAIGEHLFCEPDYRQMLIWALSMELTPEEVLARLFVPFPKSADQGSWELDINTTDNNTTITAGRLISVAWAKDLLPLTSFDWVPGLLIESWFFWGESKLGGTLAVNLPKLQVLYCQDCGLTGLDLAAVPRLTHLECSDNHLAEVNLNAVPMLTNLECSDNHLAELNLNAVPRLTNLECRNNQITELDLSAVPQLTYLMCSFNQLAELDLSAVPMLTRVECDINQLTELDLSPVPQLHALWCINMLTHLDIRMLEQLVELYYDKDKTRLIQRPDQHF